jgi:hypothetical protein
MRADNERGLLSFGVPAHSGDRDPAVRLPMGHGVDVRDDVSAVQQTARELFAQPVGAKETLVSSNGGSMSVRVALIALTGLIPVGNAEATAPGEDLARRVRAAPRRRVDSRGPCSSRAPVPAAPDGGSRRVRRDGASRFPPRLGVARSPHRANAQNRDRSGDGAAVRA